MSRRWLEAAAETIRPVPAQGLSGAPVFVVAQGGRRFILKRCGDTATRRHAEWVHSLMEHCHAAGIGQVPAVIRASDGGSFQEDAAGGLWELLAWMPGTACDAPHPAQVAAAATALAHIHLAAATLPAAPPHVGLSPGMHRRVGQARDLVARPWSTREIGPARAALVERFRRAAGITDAAPCGLTRLAAWEPAPLTLQAVLRDVWSDHVLFTGDAVSGIIDWHAAGIDTPATDIARLVGSWPDEPGMSAAFLESYERVRPLTAADREAIPFLRAAGVVCALDNWFRWTLDERREFADVQRVDARIDRLIAALPRALEHLAACRGHTGPKIN